MCFAISLGLVVVTGTLSQRKRAATTVIILKANAVLCATEVPCSGTRQDGHSEYEVKVDAQRAANSKIL